MTKQLALFPKARRMARSSASASHSGRFTDLDPDKLRGGYYTSGDVAAWLCAWAIRSAADRVLEPSCGDGAFLAAAAARFAELGLRGPEIADRLTGIEILAAEAERARHRLRPELGLRGQDVVRTADFFGWWQESEQPAFDVVVGNPPFIRYQTFPEPHRSRAMAVMARIGLLPNRLTKGTIALTQAATRA
jgi:adenine-specific DNA-methyltransferase